MYSAVYAEEEAELSPPSSAIGFIVHAVLKAIVLGILFLRGIFAAMFSDLVINELLALFVVADFWFTKNVTGKKMIGVRWFFENDEFGTEKFMFEIRANEEYISPVSSKLFWILLLVYTALPMLTVALAVVQAPFLFINFQSVGDQVFRC